MEVRKEEVVKDAVFVGIDVAKEHLDVLLRPSAECQTVSNDEDGICTLVARLPEAAPMLIVLESTGGYESAAVAALAAADLPVVVVNPRQVRDFAKATSLLEKTDQIDAGMLALFAERIHPELRQIKSEEAQEFDALVTRRRQLLEMRTAEKNRTGTARPAVKRQIQKHIRWLTRELDRIAEELDQQSKNSPLWRAQDDLLQSVPEVGPVLSRTLTCRAARAWAALAQGDRQASGRRSPGIR